VDPRAGLDTEVTGVYNTVIFIDYKASAENSEWKK
jgi:hypothetical protein